MDDLKEAFGSFDKTGNGKIDPKEVENFLFACGLNPVRADTKKIMDEIGNNQVTFEQACTFYQSMSSKHEVPSKEMLCEMFRPFDRESNGHLMLAEFRQLMTGLGDTLSDDEVTQILSFIPVTNNGTIAYEDVVNFMLSN